MIEPTPGRSAQQAWNEVSAEYNDGRQDVASSISYGPLCPSDHELQLLGDLTGLAVLDAGCGGGQNAIRFSLLGANVTALDFSQEQLAHARRTASAQDVKIKFLHTDVETLGGVPDDSVDLIFAANVLPYVERVDVAFASIRRALKPEGRFVVSLDHPLRTCFIDDESSGLTNYPERSYFSKEPRIWPFDGTGTVMRSFDRSTGEWVDRLRAAGIPLIRLLEPPVPQDVLDDLFPADGPLASLRNIPHTLILVAGAVGNETQRGSPSV